MDKLACHERMLTAYAINRLQTVDGLVLYGEQHANVAVDRVGVITFNIAGVHHGLVAAILGYEAGIGVRNGCFCAQAYVARLLGLSGDDLDRWYRAHRLGDRTHKPGMVRVSFGGFNTTDDVDATVEMLNRIVSGEYRTQYCQVEATGEFQPVDYDDAIHRFYLQFRGSTT
jgi:selenocysteine lyase/cysteine desulfurase